MAVVMLPLVLLKTAQGHPVVSRAGLGGCGCPAGAVEDARRSMEQWCGMLAEPTSTAAPARLRCLCI